MEIEKKYDEKELTISVKGRIDTDEMGNFDSLIVDFDKVDYISSAGLRLLISTQKKLKPDNIPFVIKNANDTVKEIFRMSGFDKILKIE